MRTSIFQRSKSLLQQTTATTSFEEQCSLKTSQVISFSRKKQTSRTLPFSSPKGILPAENRTLPSNTPSVRLLWAVRRESLLNNLKRSRYTSKPISFPVIFQLLTKIAVLICLGPTDDSPLDSKVHYLSKRSLRWTIGKWWCWDKCRSGLVTVTCKIITGNNQRTNEGNQIRNWTAVLKRFTCRN